MDAEDKALIGGSDLSALVGLNPYRSSWDVYRRVVEGVDTPDTKVMRRGRLMEPVIRTLLAEDYQLNLLGSRRVKDEKRPWLRLSLDDVHLDGVELPVECKSVSFFAASQYGEEGTDQVPEEHVCQVQAYMHGLRAPRGLLGALIGLDDLRLFELKADEELQAALLAAGDRFWVDHVLKKVPPAIDASPACSEWLASRFPKNNGAMLEATPEARHVAERLRVARFQKQVAEEREKEARNRLVALIGGADGMDGPGFKVTYRAVKGRTATDWEAVAQEAKVPESLIQKHTKPGAGYRLFLPTFTEQP
jgi:putative phage-type endonuclease